MKWEIKYEEEFPDSYGYCCVGIITNGSKFIFFSVCCDEPGGEEICRIFNSMMFHEGTQECAYKWTAENDEILLEALNNADENQELCGENGLLHRIQFKD